MICYVGNSSSTGTVVYQWRCSCAQPRSLWNSLNHLLHPAKNCALHCQRVRYILRRQSQIHTWPHSRLSAPVVLHPTDCRISSFKPVTVQHIGRTLGRCPDKQCALDPVPTQLVISLPAFSEILTKVVNTSPSTRFPATRKHDLVTPVLKKTSMDSAQFTDYRPISNLSSVSKLLERTAASQTSAYLNDNKLYCRCCSQLTDHDTQQRRHCWR